jgi:hypothetical protein
VERVTRAILVLTILAAISLAAIVALLREMSDREPLTIERRVAWLQRHGA